MTFRAPTFCSSIRTMPILVMILALAGCEGAAREEARAPTVASAARVELGPEASEIYRRSLVRDPEPTCAELTAGIASPTSALLEVAERVTAPPSSGMRAATCLVTEHAPEVEPQLTRWVTERATLGFGLLVLGHLDGLDDALAERLARAALAGEIAEEARPRIARSRQAPLLTTAGTGGALTPR